MWGPNPYAGSGRGALRARDSPGLLAASLLAPVKGHIRPARAGDAEALAQLRWEFRASLAEPEEERAGFVARCRAWMAARIGSSNWRCWVLEHDGALVGCLWLQFVEKVPNPGAEREQHAYITNVYVVPEMRGGAGDALLTGALDACRAAGVDSIVLWPTPGSRTLYARHGFAVREDVMEAVLDPGRQHEA